MHDEAVRVRGFVPDSDIIPASAPAPEPVPEPPADTRVLVDDVLAPSQKEDEWLRLANTPLLPGDEERSHVDVEKPEELFVMVVTGAAIGAELLLARAAPGAAATASGKAVSRSVGVETESGWETEAEAEAGCGCSASKTGRAVSRGESDADVVRAENRGRAMTLISLTTDETTELVGETPRAAP